MPSNARTANSRENFRLLIRRESEYRRAMVVADNPFALFLNP
jgi:hypothetical protein